MSAYIPAPKRLSPRVADYTRKIVADLDNHGIVLRSALTEEDANFWRSRIYNGAKRVGFIVTTHWDGRRVSGLLIGWKDEE